MRHELLENIVAALRSRHGALALLVAAAASMPAAAQISFTDATSAAGVARAGESYGASFGDLDGDGYLDIFASNHRVQPSLFLNRRNGKFYETGPQVLTWRNRPNADTHGASWSDVDNDGDQDLMVSTGTGNFSQFLVNEFGRLVDRTQERGLAISNLGGRLPVWLDYNGDSLTDVIVTQYGGIAKIYRQGADGHFTETTGDTKVICRRDHYGQLIDLTSDGRLDFLCPEEKSFPQKIYNTLPLPWQKLYDNTAPNGFFPAVPQVADSIIADFNDDGRMDMFLLSNTQLRPSSVVQSTATHFEAQLAGGNKGFRFDSEGKVTFDADWNKADEGTAWDMAKIRIGASGFHPAAWPFTLDPADPQIAGTPPAPTTASELPAMLIGFDPATRHWTLLLQTKLSSTGATIFSEAYMVVDATAAVTNLMSTGLWPSDKGGRPTLLMNYSGGFVDETAAANLDTPVQCGSVTAGDFDNDMDVDLYLACRTGASNIANILYENLGNGTFQQVAGAGGAAGPTGVAVQSGAGTADSVIAGDYDVDGFLDLFVTNGLNLRPLRFGGPNKLYHNQGNGNHWVEVDLVGKQSDRDAVGARVYATANGKTQLRVQDGQYHRWSQDAKRSHFGLAGASAVTLRVEWPSGSVQTFSDVAANKLYRITEGSEIVVAPLGVAPAYQCGKPTTSGASDSGVFLWRDCPSGEWRMKAFSAGASITYTGKIASSADFAKVSPVSLESNDVLDRTTDPQAITFKFLQSGSGADGVNFTPADKSSTCMAITAPAGVQVYYGPFRTPVTQPFNLDSQQSCTVP